MAEAYQLSQTDQRTLGTLQQKLLNELNRPDLQAEALIYIQEAIRFHQRKPFFFNQFDNTPIATWAANTVYPQGSTIQTAIGGTQYAVTALNTGTSGNTQPVFSTTILTALVTPNVPPPVPGTPGTVIDNNITWGTVGLWSTTAWTQLTTVYNINQYLPPIDYVSPQRLEITVPNLRYQLVQISYDELRDYDVVRIGGSQVGAVEAYPTMWAWYQQQFYLWPYPNSFYPITVSYRGAPPMIFAPNQTSFWTTTAEGLILAEAAYRMCIKFIHDPIAAADYLAIKKYEEAALRSQSIMQRSPAFSGIPANDW